MCSFGLLAINWNQKINGLNSCSLRSWCICRAEPGIVSDQSIQSETITRSRPETFSWCFGVFRVDPSKITPLWGPGGQHGGAGKGTPGTHSGEKAKAGTLFRSHVYGRAWQRCLGCLFQVAQCVAGGLEAPVPEDTRSFLLCTLGKSQRKNCRCVKGMIPKSWGLCKIVLPSWQCRCKEGTWWLNLVK